MNTKLYRRSRLYRSLFYTELQDRREERSFMRFSRLYFKVTNLAMETSRDSYKVAMENKDYAAALEHQEDYFYYSNLLRDKIKNTLLS